MVKLKKSQSWSMDVMIAVIVFMGAFLIFYVMINASHNSKNEQLKSDASTVNKIISSQDSKLRIVDKNQINVSRLNELKKMSYDELKRFFRIDGEFCIYLEDEQGNIMTINNTFKGIGTSDII